MRPLHFFFFFFFNDTATTEIYTLSLHDALPICENEIRSAHANFGPISAVLIEDKANGSAVISHLQSEIPGVIAVNPERSEEHTSELQSQSNLVCRLLLEKKKKKTNALLAHLYAG